MKDHESISNYNHGQDVWEVDNWSAQSFEQTRGENVSQHHRFAPECDNWQPEMNKEILESGQAKNILPYLTLNSLSDTEKASLIALAGESFDFIAQSDERIEMDLVNCLFESRIAEYVGLFDEFENNQISPKHSEARKLFCASMLDRIKEKPHFADDIYGAFFSYSPSFASYVGG